MEYVLKHFVTFIDDYTRSWAVYFTRQDYIESETMITNDVGKAVGTSDGLWGRVLFK